jgi:hypothetical protein
LKDSLRRGRAGGYCPALIHLHHCLVLDIRDIDRRA